MRSRKGEKSKNKRCKAEGKGGAAPHHRIWVCSMGWDTLLSTCRDSPQSLEEKNADKEIEVRNSVPIGEKKHSAQSTPFLQKAQNVTRITKVKEIHSFLSGLGFSMTCESQFCLQMLLILSKICASKYFKKIYRCIYVLKYIKEKGFTLVQNAFAVIFECHISFIALKLGFVD